MEGLHEMDKRVTVDIPRHHLKRRGYHLTVFHSLVLVMKKSAWSWTTEVA